MQLLNEILGIVLNHSNFFKDDLLFLFNFFLSESGAEEQIRQKVEGLGEVLIQYLDIVCRGFARREGVHLTSQRINFTRDIRGRSSDRPLEEHMFDEMGVPSLCGAFITRARIDPDAYGYGFEGWDSLGNQANPVLEDEFTVQVLPAR